MKKKQEKLTPLIASYYSPPNKKIATPADFKDWQQAYAQSWGPNVIADAENRMKQILRDADLPIDAGHRFEHVKGFGRGLHHLVAHRGHEKGSEVRYAAEILEKIAALKDAIQTGNIDQILHESLHLGSKLKEADIQINVGNGIDGYFKTKARLKDERIKQEKKAKSLRQRWKDLAGKIKSRHPEWSKHAIAIEVVKQAGFGNANTIRRII